MKNALKLALCIVLIVLAFKPRAAAAQTGFTCTDDMEIPKVECEALVALYNSTNGAGWTNKTNWLTATMPWYGVTVTDGHVSWIFLDGNNLTGPLPVEIGNLTGLRVAYLDSNHLSGSVPVTLGNLVNLERLYLEDNQLTGAIPSELGNLTKLILLNLYNNQLSGPIPPQLSNMSSLWHLLLYSNQLTGTIPVEFGNFANLQSLGLHNNLLTGSIPAALGTVSTLQFLNLNNNYLTGSIPRTLGNLTNLFTLNLSNNLLSGGIPAELGSLNQLDNLWLNNNPLSGPLPLTLTGLTSLFSFHFSNTYLCEPTNTAFFTWKETVEIWDGTGTECSGSFFKISGHIQDFQSNGVAEVELFIGPYLYSITDLQGYYSLWLPAGAHTLTPVKPPLSFTPAAKEIILSTADVVQDFSVDSFEIYLPLVQR